MTKRTVITYKNEEYEILGNGYSGQFDRTTSTHIITGYPGDIKPIKKDSPLSAKYCIYLRKIPREYVFGGVTYRADGVRTIQPDEYYIAPGGLLGYWPAWSDISSSSEYIVLKPILGEKE